MNAAPVFERVYDALRQMLRNGALLPAHRLDPALLAEELAASVTPVRDALHRLTGEQMVETTNEGFQVPVMREPDLRDLYAWNHQLLLLVLRQMGFLPADFAAAVDPAAEPADRVGQLFAAIARLSGNREHASALANASDRLHPLRRLEPQILPPSSLELVVSGGLRELRNAVGRYHRERIQAVPALVRARYRAS
jgi:DNA-binding GntR family transcriptional regulator